MNLQIGDIFAIILFIGFLISLFWYLIIPMFRDLKKYKIEEEAQNKREELEQQRTDEILSSIPKKDFYKFKNKIFEIKQIYDEIKLLEEKINETKNTIYRVSNGYGIIVGKINYNSLIKEEERLSKLIEKNKNSINLKLDKMSLTFSEFLDVVFELSHK